MSKWVCIHFKCIETLLKKKNPKFGFCKNRKRVSTISTALNICFQLFGTFSLACTEEGNVTKKEKVPTRYDSFNRKRRYNVNFCVFFFIRNIKKKRQFLLRKQ